MPLIFALCYIEEKVALTKYEAAAYSNIVINKIETMLRGPNCPFVLYVGPNKKLVKRREFGEFIRTSFVI
ncbi:excisionase [Oscillibacter sp. CU971]|uniref:excisionase n=1 Tax=Oscillibacter sp. CU971 TaxID=2780102 RepID=UPI0019599AC0|nr:excisionase [Oscillibacter sp. CU971]